MTQDMVTQMLRDMGERFFDDVNRLDNGNIVVHPQVFCLDGEGVSVLLSQHDSLLHVTDGGDAAQCVANMLTTLTPEEWDHVAENYGVKPLPSGMGRVVHTMEFLMDEDLAIDVVMSVALFQVSVAAFASGRKWERA